MKFTRLVDAGLSPVGFDVAGGLLGVPVRVMPTDENS